MIKFREPGQTGFELRWSLFGIRFRVLPSFFLFSALVAYFFVHLNLVGIAIDVGCIFVAFIFTEFVQGLVYRSYGLRSTVLLQELGGGIYPEAEPPTVLQRIVVALASPASSFLLYAIIFYSNQEYQWRITNDYTKFAYQILEIISVFWGIIGLLPIFPYPGGRVMLEIFTLVLGRNGLILTLVVSIAIALAYIAYVIAVAFADVMKPLPLPIFEGRKLPVSLILGIFFLLTTIRNWQLLQQVLASWRRADPVYADYDDYENERPLRDR